MSYARSGGVGTTQCATSELQATKAYIGRWTHAQMFAAAQPQRALGDIERRAYFIGAQGAGRMSLKQVLKPCHDIVVSGVCIVPRLHWVLVQTADNGADQVVFQRPRRLG